jgi:hypothetical protein
MNEFIGWSAALSLPDSAVMIAWWRRVTLHNARFVRRKTLDFHP